MRENGHMASLTDEAIAALMDEVFLPLLDEAGVLTAVATGKSTVTDPREGSAKAASDSREGSARISDPRRGTAGHN